MARIMTNSSRVGDPALSTRLQTLHNLYQNQENIWDIGCDHGQLGQSFKDVATVKSIHLVDISAAVIKKLKDKSIDSYISRPELFVHHSGGQDLTLSEGTHCIYIAGMGGKEISIIIDHLLPQMGANDLLVISPHRGILETRSYLSQSELTLIKELVVEEGNQFYQMMALKKDSQGPKVTVYGENIWVGETGIRYKEYVLKHWKHHQDVAARAYVAYLSAL